MLLFCVLFLFLKKKVLQVKVWIISNGSGQSFISQRTWFSCIQSLRTAQYEYLQYRLYSQRCFYPIKCSSSAILVLLLIHSLQRSQLFAMHISYSIYFSSEVPQGEKISLLANYRRSPFKSMTYIPKCYCQLVYSKQTCPRGMLLGNVLSSLEGLRTGPSFCKLKGFASCQPDKASDLQHNKHFLMTAVTATCFNGKTCLFCTKQERNTSHSNITLCQLCSRSLIMVPHFSCNVLQADFLLSSLCFPSQKIP